jgi:hypothetical protein
MNEVNYRNEGSKASDNPPNVSTTKPHHVAHVRSRRAGANAAHGLSWAGVLIPPMSASYTFRACPPLHALPPVHSEHLFRYPVQGNEGDHTERNPIAPPHRDRGTRAIAKPCPVSLCSYVNLQPATCFTFCAILHSHAMDETGRAQVNPGI